MDVAVTRSMTQSLAVAFNALGLYAIALVLAIAFAAQLLLGELPCPLCLMQRIQFAMLAVGPVLNIRVPLRWLALWGRRCANDDPVRFSQHLACCHRVRRQR